MDLELEGWTHLQRPQCSVMVLASSWMTTQALNSHRSAIISTLELIPTPSARTAPPMAIAINQPTVKATQDDNSETKTARPELFVITEMRPNAGGDALAVVDRTSGDALQASLNRIPGSSLLFFHDLLNRLSAL